MATTATSGAGPAGQDPEGRLPSAPSAARARPELGQAARLSVRDLAFRYGERHVLRQVSFDVARGEIVGLLGPNLSLIHI